MTASAEGMHRPQPGGRRRLLIGLVAAALLVLTAAGFWQAAQPSAPRTAHARAVAVEATLRCPTCQGLSIADSPSPIAAGMRQQVERQIAAGATSDQVRKYFVARYGDWILLDPPRRGIGWLVWLLPALGLLAGFALVRRTLHRRSTTHDSAPVSPDGLAAAAAFAAAPADGPLPEPIAAALADVQAGRIEAELDPTAPGDGEALARLAAALRDHTCAAAVRPPHPEGGAAPRRFAELEPEPEPEPEPDVNQAAPADRPAGVPGTRRRRIPRYVVPAAATLLFAGLLAFTLTRTLGDRPAGAVVTGDFATAPPSSSSTAANGPTSDQLAALQHATRAHPGDPTAWLAYATALDRAGRLADAEPAYRKVLALDPTNLTAQEQYAWLLTRGGSSREALTILSPLGQQRPDDPQVVLLLGLAQRGAGDPQATDTLRRYLTLAPDSPAAGSVRDLLGRTP